LSPNAPTVSEVCDYDGSTLVVREDDREEVVTERMKAYDRQTSPVLEYFRASGFDVWAVDGAGAGGPQAIAKLIQGMLKDKGYRN
jgi:adenylate kinase